MFHSDICFTYINKFSTFVVTREKVTFIGYSPWFLLRFRNYSRLSHATGIRQLKSAYWIQIHNWDLCCIFRWPMNLFPEIQIFSKIQKPLLPPVNVSLNQTQSNCLRFKKNWFRMKNNIRLTFLPVKQPTQIVHGFLVDQASFQKKKKQLYFIL